MFPSDAGYLKLSLLQGRSDGLVWVRWPLKLHWLDVQVISPAAPVFMIGLAPYPHDASWVVECLGYHLLNYASPPRSQGHQATGY